MHKEQIECFKKASLKNYEDSLVIHVQKIIPKVSKIAGVYNVRKLVQEGIQKASYFGFNYQGPVRFYIDLMLLLGCGFHNDPQFPWASNILNASDERGQMFRSKKLFVHTNNYVETVYGHNNIYLTNAIEKFCDINFVKNYHHFDDTQSLLKILNFIYPQKFEYVGVKNLLKLVEQLKSIKLLLSINHESSLLVIAGIMFAFGHKFFVDPLYPWIVKELNKDELEESQRILKIYKKIKIYLDHALLKLKG